MIADDDDGPIYTGLMDKIGTDGEDSWVRRCAGADLAPGPDPDPGDDRACIGNVKMHNKLLLFSETHGAANVSFITSSNLEDNDAASNSGTDMWNRGYTATAPDLYDHLHRYFDDMSGFTDSGWEDPADPNYYQTALDNQGCYVDIVADRISDDQNGPLRTLLAKPETMDGTSTNYHGPEVREFNSGQPHGVHQKNLLIDGHYDGKPNQKVVFTGSYNFTYRSVRVNDETWLQINDPNAHASFLRNFLDVRNAAHTCWQTSRTEGCDGGRVIQPDPTAPLNCHETADKYLGAGNLYLYSANYCDGPNDAKDNRGADSDYGDNQGNWQSSISSHRLVDDPNDCDRWFGGYHEPHRPRTN